MSAELAELRGEQQRAAASLTTTASQLAEAPPVRIQKKLEKQQETLSDSLRQLQDELKETRKTFDRAEAAAAKERRELLKTAQEEKAAALSASALERSHAEQRVAELEATLQRSESAARAASARASQGEESSLSLTKALGEVRVLVAQNEGVEAARAAAVERLEELTQVNRAADAVVMQQAVHCTLLSEAVLEAERDDNVREKAALEHAHTYLASGRIGAAGECESRGVSARMPNGSRRPRRSVPYDCDGRVRSRRAPGGGARSCGFYRGVERPCDQGRGGCGGGGGIA